MPDSPAYHLAQQVIRRSTEAGALAREALERARTVGQDLNAFITLCEEKAMAQAAAVDEIVKNPQRPSTPLGPTAVGHPGSNENPPQAVGYPTGMPLAGVPIAIKDNISYTGYPCSCGSHILDKYVPPYDATVVTRLIEAGAIIIGKTNMDEFAMGSSNETSYFGPVKNPVRHDLAPGGSSGGSAAVVAAGIVPVALGSETGGSVRQPASFCGVYGLKPTYGAVSRYGLVAFASSTDQIGPLARTVEDLALVYGVIAGHDPHDATSLMFDHPNYAAMLDTDRKFTIGIPREYFTEGLDPDVNKIVQDAIAQLRAKGHRCIDISLPMTDKGIAVYYVIACAEASANLARFDGVKFGLREAGTKQLAEMYAETRAKGFGPEVKRRIMLGTYALSSGYYDEYYIKAAKVRELIRQDFAKAFESVDLIISPTSPTPAFKPGERIDDPLAMYLSDVYTVSANLAGIPAISIPYGAVPDGRPVGVQFMAKHLDELSLFQVARILERR